MVFNELPSQVHRHDALLSHDEVPATVRYRGDADPNTCSSGPRAAVMAV